MPRTILILSATPRDTARLRADEEIREIQDAISRSRYRDEFLVVPRTAVRPKDIGHLLLTYRPSFVHFSGHARGEQGLIFEDDHGHSLLVPGDTLTELLALTGQSQVECVLLNACYSQAQIDSIKQHVPFVVGMKEAVDDRASIAFAAAFYEALGNGGDIPSAYELGCNAVRMSGLAVARIANLAGVRSPAVHVPIEPNERISSTTSVPQDPLPPFSTSSIRDAVCRVLPKLLATLFDDPMPILIRAGLPREACRGDSSKSKWSYVCAWLIEQGLWGVGYTLRVVDEAQEERFSYDVSRWAASYIRMLSGRHDNPSGVPEGANALDEILLFAHRERDRWDDYVKILGKCAGTRALCEEFMAAVVAHQALWCDFADALTAVILHMARGHHEPNVVDTFTSAQRGTEVLPLVSQGSAG